MLQILLTLCLPAAIMAFLLSRSEHTRSGLLFRLLPDSAWKTWLTLCLLGTATWLLLR